jgi:hypothetical protein
MSVDSSSYAKWASNFIQLLWRASIDIAEDLIKVYTSTTAILFLGTPHRGSDWASTADTLQRIVVAAGFDTNPQNTKALSTSSSELHLCQENFMRLYEKPGRQFTVRTFQEAQGVTGLSHLGLSGKVHTYRDQSSRIYPMLILLVGCRRLFIFPYWQQRGASTVN